MPDRNRQIEIGPSSLSAPSRTQRADLVVVGAGSAGCVVASRLAGKFGIRVVLLEPPSKESPKIDRERPSRWLSQLGSSDDWGLKTRPSPNLAARSINWPRGRGMGGSSRINAMIWFPPTLGDFTMLCDATDGAWKLAELETAYRSIESLVQPEPPTWLSSPSQDFLNAVDGYADATAMVYRRLCRRGRRWLPSELLDPIDPPVEIVRGVAERLIWNRDTAVGVRVRSTTGGFDLHASHGVVLAAGTIATPTILMRSGIGPHNDLSRHQIESRLECPSLGNHLRDHLIMPVVFQRRWSQPSFRAQPTMHDLARWQVMGTGPISSNLAECGGLFEDQTIQIHVTPTHYLTYPKKDETAWVTIGVNVTRAQSKGCVRLMSTNAEDAPDIVAPYLNDSADLEGTIHGIRIARHIAERAPLADSILSESIPGVRRSSHDDLSRSVRRYAQTLYHPVGTCRLGQGTEAVIDHHFTLQGTRQVWVVDASILPHLTLGNPNATVMTLAWLAAEQIASSL